MIDLRISLSRHPISHDEFSGMMESVRGFDFVSDVSLLPDRSQVIPAQPSTNSDYAVALKVYREYASSGVSTIEHFVTFPSWCKEHLNSNEISDMEKR